MSDHPNDAPDPNRLSDEALDVIGEINRRLGPTGLGAARMPRSRKTNRIEPQHPWSDHGGDGPCAACGPRPTPERES